MLALGQDPAIARASATYLETLIPGLFFYAWNVVLLRHAEPGHAAAPGAVAGVVAALLHVPANVAFIRGAGLGFAGAGLATSWSNGVVLSINAGYLAFAHQRTPFFTPHAHGRGRGWSAEAALTEWGPFLRLALPGILMPCAWWAAAEAQPRRVAHGPRAERGPRRVLPGRPREAFMIPAASATAVRPAPACAGAGRGVRARAASGVAHARRRGWRFCRVGDSFGGGDAGREPRTRTTSRAASRWRIARRGRVHRKFDGVLCVASGVIKACGKQWVAGPVVFLAYYVVGIPAACWLAFEKGRGAVGLAVGPASDGDTRHHRVRRAGG